MHRKHYSSQYYSRDPLFILVLFLEIINHSKTIIEKADIICNIHNIPIGIIHVDNIH